MQVKLNDNLIDVIINYKNNKNIYMRVKEGKLYVTCNKFVNDKQILEIINNNINSINKMYEKKIKKDNDNMFYYYLGNKYVVIFNEEIKKIKIDDDTILVKDKKMLDNFYKKECLRVFSNRLEKCSALFNNLPKFELKIRQMKTRWGVNNRESHTITLNSELIKKDITLIDYVIIHELCHFLQANHSKLFWNEVEKRYPYYKRARKMLNS